MLHALYSINEIQKKYDSAIKYGEKELILSNKMYGETDLNSQTILSRLIYCHFELNKDREAMSLLKLYTRRRTDFIANNLHMPQEFQNSFWEHSQTHFDYLYALCTSRWYPKDLVEFCYNNNLFMKGAILSYNLANKFNNLYEYHLLQTKWEDIQEQLEQNKNNEILHKVLSLVTEKSNQLISIGFLHSITGECLSLFEIISRAKVFQFVMTNIFSGKGTFSTIGKIIIQEYFMIEMSNEIGCIIGKTMKLIIEEQFMDLKIKQYLLNVLNMIFDNLIVSTELQKDILFLLRNILVFLQHLVL